MNPIVVFRHIECEGPGYLAEVLERRAIPYRVVAIDRAEPVPADIAGIGGLVFMGGPMSVNDPLPWIDDELALIRRAAAARLPVLGHCLGGQLISKALGGRITANPVKEIGWFDVERVADPAAAAWLAPLPERFEAFHWHGETFSIPEGCVPLLASHWCGNQAFVRGSVLALQFHVEMTATMIAEWVRLYRRELESAAGSPGVQTSGAILADLTVRAERLNRIADAFYDKWLAAYDGA